MSELLYTASYQGQSVNASGVQLVTLKASATASTTVNVWEVIAAPNVSVIIHAIDLSLGGVLEGVSVAYDYRASVTFGPLATPGSNGTQVTPAPVDARAVTPPADTTCNALVLSPGTGFVPTGTESASGTKPFSRNFKSEGWPVSVRGGTSWALQLVLPPIPVDSASSQGIFSSMNILFEEVG